MYDHDEVRQIVTEAVEEAVRGSLKADGSQLRTVIRATVGETFTTLGIQHDNPLEMQKDMRHLREWRLSTESIRNHSMLAILGIIVASGLGLLWVGFKQAVLD